MQGQLLQCETRKLFNFLFRDFQHRSICTKWRLLFVWWSQSFLWVSVKSAIGYELTLHLPGPAADVFFRPYSLIFLFFLLYWLHILWLPDLFHIFHWISLPSIAIPILFDRCLNFQVSLWEMDDPAQLLRVYNLKSRNRIVVSQAREFRLSWWWISFYFSAQKMNSRGCE
jgi:hypothetical protein